MPSDPLPTLSFLLFGPASITYDNVPLVMGRLQNRALLYRLAAQPTPVSREHLIYLFWPDETDVHGRRLLTQLLSHIRHLLPGPNLLIATPDHVQLDSSRIWSDVATFDSLCRNVTIAQIDKLMQAVTLYAGPFLDGFSAPDHPECDHWIASERIRLERLYLDALRRLINFAIAQADYRSAIEFAQRYLGADRVAEDIYYQLMKCHASLGERSNALLQYATCVRVLEQELGIAPLSETQALYQMIRAGITP